jgi:predicted metal-binding protein
MKKIILLALTAFMMVGCDDKSDADGFETIVVDSCEYLYKKVPSTGGAYAVMAHKGNCRFCKECRKQELKELVKQLKK